MEVIGVMANYVFCFKQKYFTTTVLQLCKIPPANADNGKGLNMEVVVLQDYYVFVFKLTYGVIGNTTVFGTVV